MQKDAQSQIQTRSSRHTVQGPTNVVPSVRRNMVKPEPDQPTETMTTLSRHLLAIRVDLKWEESPTYRGTGDLLTGPPSHVQQVATVHHLVFPE